MKFNEKIIKVQDKAMLRILVQKMHKETAALLTKLLKRHTSVEHSRESEQILLDLHNAIHRAQDILNYP